MQDKSLWNCGLRDAVNNSIDIRVVITILVPLGLYRLVELGMLLTRSSHQCGYHYLKAFEVNGTAGLGMLLTFCGHYCGYYSLWASMEQWN